MSRRWLVGALCCSWSTGCALLGKSDALDARYFSPEVSHSAARGASSNQASGSAASSGAELRLGRVTAASYLGERIVYRDSSYELNFYEESRWAEAPDVYLRRALARSLFEEHGVRRLLSGLGPTLEVELSEFEELRAAPGKARVRVSYRLFDNRVARREETITVEVPTAQPAAGSQPALPAVRALSEALDRAVARIVEQVTAELPKMQNVTPPGCPSAGSAVERAP
jgi:uncharacterized lipoprotein YmbA